MRVETKQVAHKQSMYWILGDPDLTCAADVTIECDESTHPDIPATSTATDECSDVTVTYQDATITDDLCLQVIQRRWKATDACGNTSECDQLITVEGYSRT